MYATRAVFSKPELLKSFLPRSSQECRKFSSRLYCYYDGNLFALPTECCCVERDRPNLDEVDRDVGFLCINVAKDFSAILHLNVTSLEKHPTSSSKIVSVLIHPELIFQYTFPNQSWIASVLPGILENL